MSCCTTCLKYMGQRRDHEGAPCPVAASFWCSQCGCYGHLPSACDEVTHVTRPRTLEELIPEDVRLRWGITTSTPIIWTKPTLEIQEREVAETNTIEVRYREGRQDSKIREVMRSYKIPTVHKMEGNIQLLRNWAVANGKKVRLVQEER
jgi:hypothetical protein